MSERIAALARRVADDPFFVASALADYARSEGLDEKGLATMLDCSTETLDLVRLCRRPRTAPPLFRKDVDRIAGRFGIKADALAVIVRRADAVAALRRRPASERGLLMAARDREEEGAKSAADDETGKESQ